MLNRQAAKPSPFSKGICPIPAEAASELFKGEYDARLYLLPEKTEQSAHGHSNLRAPVPRKRGVQGVSRPSTCRPPGRPTRPSVTSACPGARGSLTAQGPCGRAPLRGAAFFSYRPGFAFAFPSHTRWDAPETTDEAREAPLPEGLIVQP